MVANTASNFSPTYGPGRGVVGLVGVIATVNTRIDVHPARPMSCYSSNSLTDLWIATDCVCWCSVAMVWEAGSTSVTGTFLVTMNSM